MLAPSSSQFDPNATLAKFASAAPGLLICELILSMGHDMRRRAVIACLSAAVLWPFAARAQQPVKMKRLAMIDPSATPVDMSIRGNPGYTTFFEEMKRLGYVEGGNLTVERYCLEGRYDRVPEIVYEVVAARPDVIFVIRNDLTLAIMLCPKRTRFQSSPGQAIRLPLGSYRVWRDLEATSRE